MPAWGSEPLPWLRKGALWGAFLLALAAGPVMADVFSAMTGTFGRDGSCVSNPMSQGFSEDGTRVTFRWASPYASTFGGRITEQGATVLKQDDTSITLRLDPENRVGPDGALLRFVYWLEPGLDGYCGAPAGDGPRQCYFRYERCQGPGTS